MNDRRWNHLWVDGGLTEDWLRRMNDIPRISMKSACAGHRGRPPHLMYEGPEGDRDVVLALAHLGVVARVIPVQDPDSQHTLVQLFKPSVGGGFRKMPKSEWWVRVIGWLEVWYKKTHQTVGR